jgi:hypothetical protein
MAESYFEQAELTIDPQSSGQSGTTPYTGPVTVKFTKGAPAKVLDTKTIEAKAGTFQTIKWKAPDVEATEESYNLQVTCSYLEVNKVLLEATIWPKKAKIEVKGPDDATKPSCAYVIKQAGVADQTLNTDEHGKGVIPLLARAAYTVSMPPAYSILEDKQRTDGQFRDHVLKVDDSIKAKFVTPDVSKAPYKDDPDAAGFKKQWVNLKSKNPKGAELGGCDAASNEVVFTVTADPPASGKVGDKIFFELEFSRESKRNSPKPGLMATLPVVGRAEPSATKTTGHVTLTTAGGKASFAVDLGIAGGDKLTVKIGGKADVKDAEIKLINWRMMAAQVTKSSAQTAPSLDKATQGFKKVFIDFEVQETVTVAESDLPAGAMVDGTMVKAGLPAQALIVGIHNVADFKTKLNPRFASEGIPCAHLICCDVQVDADEPPAQVTPKVKGKATGKTQGMVDYPGAGSVPGTVITGKHISGSARFFEKDLNDGTPAVKECTWKEVGGTQSGAITSADYLIDQVAHGDKLFVRLPAAAKALSDAGKDIEITAKVAYANGWYAGWCTSGGRHIVIKLGGTDAAICSTVMHEVGHAIAQAPDDPAAFPGMPAPPHGRYYTNNRGHKGGHCADGIDDAWYNDQSKPMDTSHAAGKCTCIMWGGSSALVDAAMAFCAKCEPYVKGASVEKVTG